MEDGKEINSFQQLEIIFLLVVSISWYVCLITLLLVFHQTLWHLSIVA